MQQELRARAARTPVAHSQRQRDRRNLTKQQLNAFITHVVQVKDQRKPSGMRTDLAPIGARSGKSAAETAEQLSVATRIVERTLAVLTSDAEDVKAQLLSGTMMEAGFRHPPISDE